MRVSGGVEIVGWTTVGAWFEKLVDSPKLEVDTFQYTRFFADDRVLVIDGRARQLYSGFWELRDNALFLAGPDALDGAAEIALADRALILLVLLGTHVVAEDEDSAAEMAAVRTKLVTVLAGAGREEEADTFVTRTDGPQEIDGIGLVGGLVTAHMNGVWYLQDGSEATPERWALWPDGR